MLRKLQEFAEHCLQGLSRFGAALVRPIERLIGGATDKVLTATEQVGRVESVLFRLLRVLTWPFRLVGRLFQLILPEAVVSLIVGMGRAIQDLSARLGTGLLHLAGILNLDRAVLGLVWLLQPVWRPLAALGVFCNCWLNSREYRRALMALPAIVLATLVLGVGTWHTVFGKSQVRAKYREANREALESHDYALAELYDQKLANLGEDTQRSQFRTAEALTAEGKLDEAYERMKLLAPEDRPGYAQAHYWIIQHLLNGKLGKSPEETEKSFKAHLSHLETMRADAPVVRLLKASLLARDNKLEEAAQTLEPIVQVTPAAAFDRMRLNLQLNRRDQAQQDARALVTHMKSRTRANRQLNQADYQQWLAAEEVLGNLTQMRVILERWHASDSENLLARKTLATVYRRQAGKLLRDPLPDEKQIVELWLKAARLDSRPDALLKLAHALYLERDKTPVYSRILQALHESPETPADLLIAVGTEAAQQREFDEAKPFFAAAVAQDPDNPIAWNNYGLVLGEGDNSDLEKALEAVNKAVKLVPKEYRFRETRGQILVKMKRWQAAIDDLEFSLNGLPDLTEIHQSLATAYQAIGENELAQLHQQQVD